MPCIRTIWSNRSSICSLECTSCLTKIYQIWNPIFINIIDVLDICYTHSYNGYIPVVTSTVMSPNGDGPQEVGVYKLTQVIIAYEVNVAVQSNIVNEGVEVALIVH